MHLEKLLKLTETGKRNEQETKIKKWNQKLWNYSIKEDVKVNIFKTKRTLKLAIVKKDEKETNEKLKLWFFLAFSGGIEMEHCCKMG